MYDPVATRATLDPVVSTGVEGVCALLIFEGEEGAVEVEASATLRLAQAHGAQLLDPGLSESWWEHRYDFYSRPTIPRCPPSGGPSTSWRATRGSAPSTRRCRNPWPGPTRRSGWSCVPTSATGTTGGP